MANYEDWHIYQLCKYSFDPEKESYRCLLRKSENHKEPDIVCCCIPEHCDKAYNEASKKKFKHLKDFIRIHPVPV